MNICIPNTMAAYLRNLPIVMLVTVMGRLERISPSSTVIALPITGRKAKKPVYAGEVSYAGNGRKVEVWTTEPCLQVYTANWASYDQTAKGGEHLSFRCGVALETQHAPDSPNKPKWPTTFVKAGETYRSTTEFRFSAE